MGNVSGRSAERKYDAPELGGVHSRVGPCYRSAALSEVALAVAKPTLDLCRLACLALGLWGRLETFYLLETAAGDELRQRGRAKGLTNCRTR